MDKQELLDKIISCLLELDLGESYTAECLADEIAADHAAVYEVLQDLYERRLVNCHAPYGRGQPTYTLTSSGKRYAKEMGEAADFEGEVTAVPEAAGSFICEELLPDGTRCGKVCSSANGLLIHKGRCHKQQGPAKGLKVISVHRSSDPEEPADQEPPLAPSSSPTSPEITDDHVPAPATVPQEPLEDRLKSDLSPGPRVLRFPGREDYEAFLKDPAVWSDLIMEQPTRPITDDLELLVREHLEDLGGVAKEIGCCMVQSRTTIDRCAGRLGMHVELTLIKETPPHCER